MKTLLMLLVFLSGFLIVSGIHEQRLEEARAKRKVVYRYIPRSAIDEQYYGAPASAHFQGMFGEGKSPWLEARTPQEEAGDPRYEWAEGTGPASENGSETASENGSETDSETG